jgi:hypothetical protein
MRSDKIEKEKRLRIVQEWILQDQLSIDIIANCVAKWGISERQAKRYISEAHKIFAKITEKIAERRLNYHIQRRNKLLRDLDPKLKNTPYGITAQLNVLQDIAKLEKLYITKIEHSGENGEPIKQVTTIVISKEEIRDISKTLEENV